MAVPYALIIKAIMDAATHYQKADSSTNPNARYNAMNEILSGSYLSGGQNGFFGKNSKWDRNMGMFTSGGFNTFLDKTASNSDKWKAINTGGLSDLFGGGDKRRKKAERLSENTNTVTQAFRDVLGRDPDPEGLQAYLTAINNHELNSPEDVRNSLMGSDEYKNMTAPMEEEGGFEEGGDYSIDPELQAKLEADMKKYNEILDSIGVVSPEREKQITEAGDAFKKEFLDGTQTDLENALIGKGLRGSSVYGEQVTNLLEDANIKAKLYKEDLFAQDEATKLAQLNALQAGLGSDYATKLNFMTAGDELNLRAASLENDIAQFRENLAYNNFWNQKNLDNSNYWKEKEYGATNKKDDFLSTWGPAIASYFGSKAA